MSTPQYLHLHAYSPSPAEKEHVDHKEKEHVDYKEEPSTWEYLVYKGFFDPPQLNHSLEGSLFISVDNHFISCLILTSSIFAATILFLLLRYNKDLKYNLISSILALILCVVTVMITIRSLYADDFFRKLTHGNAFVKSDKDIVKKYNQFSLLPRILYWTLFVCAILMIYIVIRAVIDDFKNNRIRF